MRVKGFFGKGLVAAVVLAMVLAAYGTGVCAPAKTVAVFPFTMNSPQDLGFLQNGLFSMLSSRLADPGKVEVLDRETVDAALVQAEKSGLAKGTMTEDKARMIGADMGVDFVLFGSLTHFGESVSLDARMLDVAGQKETLAFFEQSNAMGDVIPLVNSFAGDINEKVFNRRIDNKLYVQQAPEAPQAPGALQNAGGAAVYGGGMMAMGAAQRFTANLHFKGIITAMAVGDLKNDGIQRVVTATDYTLTTYTLKGTQLVQENSLEYSSTNRIVALDVADINKNGYPEIFVTSISIHRNSLQSFVVEYNGSDYRTLVDGQAYYYRVLESADGSQVLMGQKSGRGPFDGRIYTMMPQGDGYEDVKRIRTPRNVSVLSYATGAVTGAGAEESVMINRHGKLVVTNDSGGVDWEGSQKYGNTGNYWLMPRNDADASMEERMYLHPRVKFYDLGQDGTNEVFVIRNLEVGGGVLGRYKRFKDGHIEVLSWNGISLAPVFQTQPVQGWISDFAIADLNGDGVRELVVSVVTRTKLAILSKDKDSNIISYPLE